MSVQLRLLPALTTLALLAALPACAPVGEEQDGGAAIELGTGELEYEPLADGQDLDVIFGPQGGYHVLGSMRVRGVEPGVREDLGAESNPTVVFCLVVEGESRILRDDDGMRVTRYHQGLDTAPEDAGPWTHEMVGRLVKLDITDDEQVVGRDAELEVTITDANGLEIQDTRSVHLVPWPFND